MKINGIVTGKFVLLLGIGCVVMLACANDAKAYPTPLPPSINFAISDQHELGQVRPPVPEGNADITQYVNFMIGLSLGESGHVIIGPHDILVTRSMNNFGPLPSPVTLALRGTGTTINFGADDYLFAHYGGPLGGFAEVWYVGDLSGMTTIPPTAFRHGLSGWALFTASHASVPDGGATGMLLGAALGALGIARRFLMR
jgi:protein with PEP-CTERM/exosortase system signal